MHSIAKSIYHWASACCFSFADRQLSAFDVRVLRFSGVPDSVRVPSAAPHQLSATQQRPAKSKQQSELLSLNCYCFGCMCAVNNIARVAFANTVFCIPFVTSKNFAETIECWSVCSTASFSNKFVYYFRFDRNQFEMRIGLFRSLVTCHNLLCF